MQILIKIYHAVQELWVFSLKRPRPAELMLVEAVLHISGWTMLKCISMQTLIQIHQVVQAL